MASGIYNLVEGSLVQKLRFDNIANNLANINTTGFKMDILAFDRVHKMQWVSETDFTPGPATYTGNKLDVALVGNGFFKVQTPSGIRYTRDGSFTLNADRVLVTQRGDTVLGQNGPIRIEGGDVAIERDGQVVVENATLDRLFVAHFEDPRLLRKEGNAYYVFQGKGTEVGNAENVHVQQGHLERSNVAPTLEMIKMLESLRAFESAQKAIQVIDEITGKLVNDPVLTQ